MKHTKGPRSDYHKLKAVIYGLALLLCLSASKNLTAQKLSASLDRDKILLGEQVTLTIKAEDINPLSATLVTWANLPDTGNHVEVVKREETDSTMISGLNTYVQKITITSFDSGKWQLPDISVTFADKPTGKPVILHSAPVILEVLPVDVSSLKDYHPIKDILEVQARSNIWLIILLIAGGLLLIFLLWWFLFRKKKSKAVAIKPKDPVTNYQQAIEALKELEKSNYPVNIFYLQLDKIYRTYLDAELNIHTMQSTTDEVMMHTRDLISDTGLRTEFFQLARLISAVKFAKYLPPKDEANAIGIVRKTIDFIYNNQRKVNADRVV
ncbi:hypothetical protein QTN47_00155 [Danxiaibacter flavus]|uniref:Protein BatD n=1 Tax=Danxiaibacter flavus TaxID=3049108 RepID=A0ABV3Z7Q5_9BACT|nr:hypothetical protein QNM32_00155 [Chitinophagaceae bacterium DXS]